MLTRDYMKQCSRNNVQYYWHNGWIPNANPVLMIEKLKGLLKEKISKKTQPKTCQLTHFIIITSLLSHFTNYVKLRSAVIFMPPSQTRHHYTVFSSIIVWLSCIPVFKDHLTAGIIPHPVSPVFIPYASGLPSISIHWNIQIYYS